MTQTVRIISGFPGIGKSYLANNSDGKVLDLDSSSFSWLSPGERNPDFPANYIAAIKEKAEDPNLATIVVSSHAAVREGLRDSGLDWWLVYPQPEAKPIYLQRYKDRGSPETFIQLMDENFEKFAKECVDFNEVSTGVMFKVQLVGDQNLSNSITDLTVKPAPPVWVEHRDAVASDTEVVQEAQQ